MTIDQQMALDEALVPHESRLRIRKSNFCLRSDITSKESNLQLVYDVLHSGEIWKLTDVNINKLHQPWRSFAAVINKCLRGKSTGYDSLRLSQAQILWGMYHKKNIDFAYLLWIDFVYQVEHKDNKKGNEMYYPKFTKVIIHYFMAKDPLIPRRNKVNWHYVRDDQIFTTIKLVLRHQNTQQFGVMFPVELTNEDIKNSEAYKEYYVIASGATPPKTKASVRKTKSSSDTTLTPPSATATKRSLQQTHISQASGSGANEGTGIIPRVPDVPTDESDEQISWKSSDKDDDDEVVERRDDQDDDNDQDDDDQDDNDDDQDTDNDGDDFVMTMKICIDVNINLEGRDVQMIDIHTTQEFEDTHVTLLSVNPDGQQQSLSMSSQFVTSMLNLSPNAGIDSLFKTTPRDLPNFGSLFGFDHRLKTLKANFSEFVQTNQFTGVVSSIPGIAKRYMDQRMNEAVKVVVQIQSNRLRDKTQAENEEFLNNLDENIQNIIKEQVKEQIKLQVSNILPKIEKTVNEQLEAEVFTRSSNSSKTSYAMAADLSKMELKKILIEKMESNKSIHLSDE
uniref:Uncharacterized protein n=1 Tax=Tanacetum cinerariifolium TaxID=118510 RepID=A0A6L2NJW1_TANCI|nr:hypothetical protein [Tanacetum cinerariifolium]